jgi:hypothetical protein
MQFREGDEASVFLVLPNRGDYKDVWNPKTETYVFQGHDSRTVSAGGKSPDQLLMYDDGRMTQNGRFFKMADAIQSGERTEPFPIQVYEKIEAGAWFDKGIFNLGGAHRNSSGNIVFTFDLQPADYGRLDRDISYFEERMIPISEKVQVWARERGRCQCGSEAGLRFVGTPGVIPPRSLQCAACRGERIGFLD